MSTRRRLSASRDALRLKLVHDARLAALASFIGAYEADQGEITAEEVRLAGRKASASAIPVRGPTPTPST
ncbi:hypothetical protein L6R53_01085 [Myxococcota bacterium]|nr:hypothetical protein [Myxococcota bacterium]